MAKNTDQAFESIRIVGGLLSSKVLQDARRYQLPGQSKEDYAIEAGLTFNEEIGRYWRIAQGRWQEFQQHVERKDLSSHKIAQQEWLLPLLTRVLGYDIAPSDRKVIGEREFPITHSAHQGTVPMVLCGADFDLDKGDAIFGQEGRKRSPMGLAQEYLNAETHCLWAVVSNGRFLRLLRDNPAMTRPAYIEVDFTKLFEEDNYADFATVWLLLQASRLAPRNQQIEQCWLEEWREKGQDEGERALDKLRYGVADALRELGTGFVAHKNNQGLREQLSSGELSTDSYFQQVLRLVYRFLFLLTAEDRDVALLPKDYEGSDYSNARKLYEQGYSVTQLRERSRLNRHYDNHGDAWQQLLITFSGFAKGQPLLAQPALGGLFAVDQCAHLETAELENRYLYRALFNLCYFEHNQTLSRINYRDMDTEEFGSVYESLLELIPQLNTEGRWQFSFMGDAADESAASGHSRKLTGSYYTPDSLVQELIKSALEPVIADRLSASPQQPREAILSITVCDPACGSGHFLLAAARRLASELAAVDAGTDQPTEQHYRHAIRDVVRSCIYGVDLNPMAVELCKTGLWLESIEPGKPLSFLDMNIRPGNALLGTTFEAINTGIPDAAITSLLGDDEYVAKLSIQRHKSENKGLLDLFDNANTFDMKAVEEFKYVASEENTIDQVEEEKRRYLEVANSQDVSRAKLLLDLWCCAFVWKKTPDFEPITYNLYFDIKKDVKILSNEQSKHLEYLLSEYKFFHWQIEFPAIFSGDSSGFDVVLGNPPWERANINYKEFFASRSPCVLEAKNKKEREIAIAKLETDNPSLFDLYQSEMRRVEGLIHFIKTSEIYSLTIAGFINYYSCFAEKAIQITKAKEAAVGMVLQSGIATDDTNKDLFVFLMENGWIRSIYDFINTKKLFKIDSRMKYSLVTLSKKASKLTDFAFFLELPSEIEGFKYQLSIEDIVQINPNTKTCTTFSNIDQANIVKKIHRNSVPVFSDSTTCFSKKFDVHVMLNSTNDKHKFVATDEYELSPVDYVPVYESKLFWLYDHKSATFKGCSSSDIEKGNTKETSLSDRGEHSTRYFVIADELVKWKKKYNHNHDWMFSIRKISSPTNERTIVASILPNVATTDSANNIVGLDITEVALLLANFNSLILDFAARTKVGNQNLNQWIIRQLPVVSLSTYTSTDIGFIKKRVIELVFTNSDLSSFVSDLGYEGSVSLFDKDRRHRIKCELDAYYAKLYGLTRDELRYIIDPTDVMGKDYPSETFRVLKNKELKEFGEYRTQRLVLEAWDKLEAGDLK
ncbi:MAG: N-6 DNA methylase [Pseudomonadales bacterium]|nr:N-6 DNA methylase [Pseudomonadales bacterium]